MARRPFREYLDDDNFYYVPEIFDCISTKAAEMNGFKMVMISSSDFACSHTGIPDLNLLSADEYCTMISRITYMNDMPLFVDADEGFGRPLQTYHACKKMAAAGADCILVSDGKAMSQPGLATIEEMRYRLNAAKDGMSGTNCTLLASCTQDVDEQYEDFVERCNRYLEFGADLLCPLQICVSKKYGGKIGAAKKVAQDVHAKFWYPDLDPGDRGEEIEKLVNIGYKFTGIHYSFRAAMYAMLDCGRHVFENKDNEYVMKHYDYTGYHFYYSPMTCFLNDQEWVKREQKYCKNPEDAFAYRQQLEFCGPTDLLYPTEPLKD